MLEKIGILATSLGLGAFIFVILAAAAKILRPILLAASLCLALLAPIAASAQPAPNRSAEVARIVNANPGALRGDPARADERKLALLPVIVRELNRIDNGRWGLLTKQDQNGKIPADVIVWRPTREHFDVLTDSGPMWGAHGVLENPAWVWTAVPGAGGAPSGDPSPDPAVPAPDLAPLLARLEALERAAQSLAEAVPALERRADEAAALPAALEVLRERLDALAALVDMLSQRAIPTDCEAYLNFGFGRTPVPCSLR